MMCHEFYVSYRIKGDDISCLCDVYLSSLVFTWAGRCNRNITIVDRNWCLSCKKLCERDKKKLCCALKLSIQVQINEKKDRKKYKKRKKCIRVTGPNLSWSLDQKIRKVFQCFKRTAFGLLHILD